jgi:hypothetical protein
MARPVCDVDSHEGKRLRGRDCLVFTDFCPLCAVLIISQLCFVACYSQEHVVHSDPSNSFSYIFDSFVYVGIDVNRESHNVNGTELPAAFLPDHDYVFHHVSAFDEAEFARVSLPRYLEKFGFSVTKVADAGQGFVAIGPAQLWSVNFSRRNCLGSIGNRVCLDLTRPRLFRTSRWQPSDYVLTLHGNCDAG